MALHSNAIQRQAVYRCLFLFHEEVRDLKHIASILIREWPLVMSHSSKRQKSYRLKEWKIEKWVAQSTHKTKEA